MATLLKNAFSIMLMSFILLFFLSCNKSNEKATTRIKCTSCLNGGSCVNDTCRCPTGYAGIACQTLARQKFITNWQVSENSTQTGRSMYSIFINPDATGSNSSVIFEEFYRNYFFNGYVHGYISGDSIYIPTQQLQGKIVVGYGYIHSDPNLGKDGAITMRYQVTDTFSHTVDDFGYNPADGTSPSQWIK